MSEQIVLPGFSGDVVRVNGLCYEFTGYTEQPIEDLDVTAKFETCEECSSGSSASEESELVPEDPPAVPEFASSSAASSALADGPPCNNCNALGTPLSNTYTATFTGLCSHYTTLNNRPTLFTFDEDSTDCRFFSDYTDNWYPYYLFYIYWDPTPGNWKIQLEPTPISIFTWTGGSDPCDPTGPWGSHTDCSDMFGAHCTPLTTCVVSLP